MLPKSHSHLKLPTLPSPLEPFQSAIEQLVKPAWILKVRNGGVVSTVNTQLLGTTPYVPKKIGWPTCTNCKKPIDFVWQINFADFSGIGTFTDVGLFQFFYCLDCFAFPPEEFGWDCRWYPDFDSTKAKEEPQERCPYVNQCETEDAPLIITVDILPFLSVPAKFSDENPIPIELQNKIVGEKESGVWAIYSFTKGLFLEDQQLSRIGGYPPWIEESQTPNCPICSQPATFVGAVGSEDYLWCDTGYWYFFACKKTAACQGLHHPLMIYQCY